MTNTETIVAVVVTYNRLQLLQECIAALQAQTRKPDHILVINNSSTDGSTEWLEQQTSLECITQPNDGGAAGFYTGIKTGYEKGYDWVWCMDDDGRPALNALELLMDHSSLQPCVLNCLVVSTTDADDIVFKTGPYTRRRDIKESKIAGVANFFNGSLYHKKVIETVGLPIKDLIIWGDEAEYFNRIKFQYKFPLFTVAASLHYHPKQSGVFYKKEWSAQTDWKPFFYIRNKMYYYKSRFSSSIVATLNYLLFVGLFAATIIFFQKKDKWKKFRILWLGAKAGLKNDLTFTIQRVKTLL